MADCPRDPGLTDVLLGKVAWSDAVQRTTGAPDFLPSGAPGNVTLSLLYANKLREFLTTAKQHYDRVLFDSPPIIGVSDSSVLASVADGTILLIQHRRNPESMVVRARQIIDGLKVPIIGVILNQVPTGTGEDYGYYTNNYSYYSHDPADKLPGALRSDGTRASEKLELTEKSNRSRKA